MNPTIELQLNHRSIRRFKEQPLTREEVDLLVKVAASASTSSYMQACSIISITDPKLKHELHQIGAQAFGKQEYIRDNGHLFVFVADTARNAEIAEEQGQEPIYQGSADRFLAAVYDATIASQNLVVAAESLGMGVIYLGSILNDTQKVVELLQLPKYTFPVFALAVGYPDQTPDAKPRLPAAITHMENRYVPIRERKAELAEYDQQLSEYYQARGDNARAETFSHMATQYTRSQFAKRPDIAKVIKSQGFLGEI
ncbi:NADPH-dependent oxidoreductase [Caviibacterium pharyngocola]|uniref:NADPH-dependent oxidoreductase n=1 Tax=Caviibacterium pharyngocola TaxID=28159 RepID=A0A2M8RTN4_9PAST|nr:NADPH-dependent oxidoreductase [Caviibacterium pharyngocola]PJG82263.1 NADPH-dependent oxidoreductase [Caviibacterium pharyngocola]